MNRRYKPLGRSQAGLASQTALVRSRREDLSFSDPSVSLDMPSGLPLRQYGDIFRRRKWVVVETLIVSLIAGLLVTHFTKPVYRATAKLEVEDSAFSVESGDGSNPLSSLFALNQQQPVDTQLELLTEPALVDGVAKKVGPVSLSADIVRQTNVIEVNGESSSPQAAARGANELIAQYIKQLAQRDVQTLKSAKDFVTSEGAAAAKKLASAQAALKSYEEANGIVDVNSNQADQMARVASMQTDLNATQMQLNADNNDLHELEAQLRAQTPLVKSETQTSNAAIEDLRGKIDALKVEKQGLTGPDGFTESAPQIQAIDAQIDELQKQLDAEPAMVPSVTVHDNAAYGELEGKINDEKLDIAVMQSKQADLQSRLAQAKSLLSRFPQLQMTLATLSRNVDNAVAADKMFKSDLEELNLREKAKPMPVHIAERAAVPDSPVRPKPMQNLLIAGAVGLLLGIILGLIREYTDDHIHSGLLAEEHLNLPVLGEIPNVRVGKPLLLPQMAPIDPIVESYRIIRASLQFAAVDNPITTLLVTSSVPKEGKSTVSANLAFAMAMDGKRVVLVDADLRRPSLHADTPRETPVGLSDVLAGSVRVEDALLPYQSDLDVLLLSAGSMRDNPSELLGGRKFRDVLEKLQSVCDVVIVDSSPMLSVSDTRRMAPAFDGVVVVMEAGKTVKEATRRTTQLLLEARARVIGLIINKVKVQQNLADYGHYGHYGFYAYGYGAEPPSPRKYSSTRNGGGPYPAEEEPKN